MKQIIAFVTIPRKMDVRDLLGSIKHGTKKKRPLAFRFSQGRRDFISNPNSKQIQTRKSDK